MRAVRAKPERGATTAPPSAAFFRPRPKADALTAVARGSSRSDSDGLVHKMPYVNPEDERREAGRGMSDKRPLIGGDRKGRDGGRPGGTPGTTLCPEARSMTRARGEQSRLRGQEGRTKGRLGAGAAK